MALGIPGLVKFRGMGWLWVYKDEGHSVYSRNSFIWGISKYTNPRRYLAGNIYSLGSLLPNDWFFYNVDVSYYLLDKYSLGVLYLNTIVNSKMEAVSNEFLKTMRVFPKPILCIVQCLLTDSKGFFHGAPPTTQPSWGKIQRFHEMALENIP